MVQRRSRAPGGRPLSCTVALSVEEATVLRVAAARDGMALGSWIGQAAVRVAQQGVMPQGTAGEQVQAAMMLRAEVAEHRRLLRNVGGNLNDIARHANITGHLHAATERVLQRVDELVGRVQDLMGQLDTATAFFRPEARADAGRRSRTVVMDMDPGEPLPEAVPREPNA